MCHDSVAVFKEYNLKWHFQTKHSKFGSNLSESELQQKANNLLRSLKRQQNVFVKQTTIQEAATKASFVLAYKIAKQNKTFPEWEFLINLKFELSLINFSVNSMLPSVEPSSTIITS